MIRWRYKLSLIIRCDLGDRSSKCSIKLLIIFTVFAFWYFALNSSRGNSANPFLLFTSLWNRWKKNRRWSFDTIFAKFVAAKYCLACAAQMGQGRLLHICMIIWKISCLNRAKYSGFIFSAREWNKNHVGSPHIIVFLAGAAFSSCLAIGAGSV